MDDLPSSLFYIYLESETSIIPITGKSYLFAFCYFYYRYFSKKYNRFIIVCCVTKQIGNRSYAQFLRLYTLNISSCDNDRIIGVHWLFADTVKNAFYIMQHMHKETLHTTLYCLKNVLQHMKRAMTRLTIDKIVRQKGYNYQYRCVIFA